MGSLRMSWAGFVTRRSDRTWTSIQRARSTLRALGAESSSQGFEVEGCLNGVEVVLGGGECEMLGVEEESGEQEQGGDGD